MARIITLLFKTMIKLKLNSFVAHKMPQDHQDEYIDFLKRRTNHYYFLAIYISLLQGENLKKMAYFETLQSTFILANHSQTCLFVVNGEIFAVESLSLQVGKVSSGGIARAKPCLSSCSLYIHFVVYC